MYGGVYVAKDVGLVVRSAPAVPTPPPVLSAPARCSHRHLAPSRLPPTSQPAPRPVSHQCPPSLLMTWHRTRGPSLTKSATSTVRTCGTSTRSARSVSRPRAPATAPRGTWTTCDASMAVVRIVAPCIHRAHATCKHNAWACTHNTFIYTYVHTTRAHSTCTHTHHVHRHSIFYPNHTHYIHTHVHMRMHMQTCLPGPLPYMHQLACTRACLAHSRPRLSLSQRPRCSSTH